MSDIIPEDGFFYNDRPRSVEEAVAQKSLTREVNLTKAVIQKYIETWFSPNTFQRRLIEEYAPRAMQFISGASSKRNIHFFTDVSWEMETMEAEDSNLRKVQIRRFMEQVGENYPAILIIDGGFRNRTAGLGDIQGGRMVGPTIVDFDVVTDLVINLDIMVAALDESTASDLALFVAQTIGPPLRRFGGGNQLTGSDKNTSYQVTFPLEISPSALSRENITDDPVNSKWTTSISLEVQFESVMSARTALPIYRGHTNLGEAGGAVGQMEIDVTNVSEMYPPVIDGPDTIRMNCPVGYRLTTSNGYPVMVSNDWKMVVTDYRIATFNPRTMIMQPKRIGVVELRVVDRTKSDTDENGHKHDMVIARKQISVIR